MKKLTCLLLAVVMLIGVFAAVFASQDASAANSPDPDYEYDENDLVRCTEKFAYDQGVNFFKMWWIANNEKDYFRELDFSYYPPYYSPILKNRRDSSYMQSMNQWRIMTFEMDDWGPGHINNKIKAFVEGMLFNLLYDANNSSPAVSLASGFTDVNGDWSKNIQNFGVSSWEEIASTGSLLKKMTPIGDIDFMSNNHDALVLEGLSEEFGVFSDASKLFGYVETVGEYVEGIAKLKEMVGTNQALESILLRMKNYISRAPDNNHDYDPAYSSSLENFASYFSDYMTEERAILIFTGEKTAREAYSESIDFAWEAASKAWIAAQAINGAATTGKFLGNLLTGIDDQYNAFNELEVYFDMEQLLRMAIGSIIDDCNNGNLSAAEEFPTAFALLNNMYNIGLDCYETYADKLYRDGILNNLWIIGDIQKAKYDDAINSAESMRESMKELFLHAEVGANNAYYEAVQKYNPELLEDAERKSVPDDLPPESEAKENFDALQPTFGMHVEEDKTMTRDLEIYGSIHLEQGKLNLSGHQLTVYGDVYIDGGELVNRGILDVRGSVYQTAGKLTVPGGCSLLVGGDYVLTPAYNGTNLNLEGGKLTVGGTLRSEDSSYSDYYAKLSVLSSAELEVGGDISISKSGRADLTSGAVRLGGGFTAASSNNINGSADCTVTLRGTGDARVRNLVGAKLKVENAADRTITFADTVKPSTITGSGLTVTAENLRFGGSLTDDLTINGDVTLYSDVKLNGHSLTVNGNVTQDNGCTVTVNAPFNISGSLTGISGNLNVNQGGELNVGGAVSTKGSLRLYLNAGKMTTGGDLTLEGLYASNYGSFTMENGAELNVNGKLHVVRYVTTNLNSGAVTVLDEIVSEETAIRGNAACTVTVGGTGDVRVQNLSSPTLTIEDAANRNITFANTVAPSSLNRDAMTVTAENLSFGGSLADDLTITGDVTLYSDVKLNGHSLTVNGNVTQDNGCTVTVNAPFNISGSLTGISGNLNVNQGGELNVGGAVSTKGSLRLDLNAGKMTTGGDLTLEGLYASNYGSFTMENGAELNVNGKLHVVRYVTTNLNSGAVTVLDEIVSEETAIRGNAACTVTVGGTGDVRVQNLSSPTLTIEDAANRNITFANTVAPSSLNRDAMTVTAENLSFGGSLADDLTITGDVTLYSDVKLNGHSLTVNGNVTQDNGCTVTVNAPFNISGSLTGISGNLNVNQGGELNVGGAVSTKGSLRLDLNAGKMTTGGDLTLEGLYASNYGSFTMENGAELNVNGKLHVVRYVTTNLNSGAVTVLDEIVSEETAIRGNAACTVTVGGTGDVRVQNLSSPTLTIEDAANRNITFANTVAPSSLNGDAMTVTAENLSFGGTLGCDLAVTGDAAISKDVSLAGHTLTVNGSLRQTDGTLTVGAGTLDVSGNYTIASLNNGSDATGSGILSMNNESSVVKVGGNMLVWSSKSSTLTNGVLTIAGHFTQKGTSYTFTASGDHITVLNGTKLQRITFENTRNKFNILRLSQYEEMYVFSPEQCWNEMKRICDHSVTEVRGHVDATCLEDGYSGDIYCVLCGDLIDQGYVLEAEGHKMVVDPPADPTCTEPGHTYSRYCSVCGMVFVASTETAPALGHDWGDWVVTREPTATQPGEETRTCKNDPTHKETREIPAAQTNPFTDVAKGKFYYEPVLWAISQNPQITTGVDAKHFEPDRTCTRAHVVTFLWRANGCPEPTNLTSQFKDVKDTSKYYYKAVLWAAEQGITNGYSDGTFRPDDECTRGQVVTFLWRANGSPEPTTTNNPFTDVPSGKYYSKAVLWAMETGITTGRTNTTFGPDDACTRGHVVTFLYRDKT